MRPSAVFGADSAGDALHRGCGGVWRAGVLGGVDEEQLISIDS